jgi:hypothetical protein
MELELRIAMSAVRPRKNIFAAGPQAHPISFKLKKNILKHSHLLIQQINF